MNILYCMSTVKSSKEIVFLTNRREKGQNLYVQNANDDVKWAAKWRTFYLNVASGILQAFAEDERVISPARWL